MACISAQTCALGALSGTTKRDLSPVPQIWAEKQAFSACLICRLHPGEIWGKAFANAWKMRAVLQPAWMLPQSLQLQGRWIDPQNNPTQTWPWDDASKMPCLMHILRISICKIFQWHENLDLLKSITVSIAPFWPTTKNDSPQVPVLQDHVKDAQAGKFGNHGHPEQNCWK